MIDLIVDRKASRSDVAGGICYHAVISRSHCMLSGASFLFAITVSQQTCVIRSRQHALHSVRACFALFNSVTDCRDVAR